MAPQDFLNQPGVLIDLAPPVSPEDKTPEINLYDDRETDWPPSMELATLRATKADYGLGALSPGVDTIANSLQTRTAGLLRQSIADKIAIQDNQAKVNAAREIANHPTMPEQEKSQQLQGLVASPPATPDPDLVFENSYGRATTQALHDLRTPEENPLTKAVAKDPDKVFDLSDLAADIIARKEYYQRKGEDITGKLKQFEVDRQGGRLGFGDYLKGVWNTGKSFIPLYSWARATDAIKDMGVQFGLPGTRMEDFVSALYTRPQGEAKAMFDTVMERLKDDPMNAQKFAQAAASYSTSDKLLDNAFGVLDIASSIPVGVGIRAAKVGVEATVADAVRAGRAYGSGTHETMSVANNIDAAVGNAMKDLIRANADEPVNYANLTDKLGDTEKSSAVQFFERMKDAFTAKDPFGEAAAIEKRVPGMFNPTVITADRGNFSRVRTDWLEDALNNISGTAFRALTDTLMVKRSPDEAIAAYVAAAADDIKRLHPGIENGLLETRHIPAEQNAANVHNLQFHFGRPDGQLLGADEVQYMAEEVYKFPRGSYKIEPQGMSYRLVVTKPVDETSPLIRDALITTENTTPKTLLNAVLGRVRTPEDTLSEFNRHARHVAVHGSQNAYARAREIADTYIKPLDRVSTERLDRLLAHNHLEVGANGQPGNWYKTLGEYERGYRRLFNIAPTEKEAAAYFASTSFSDLDYVMRNLNMHGDMSRMGLSHVRAVYRDENGDVINSPWFYGKVVDRLPAAADAQAGVAVIEDGLNTGWTTTKGGKRLAEVPDQSVQTIYLSKNMTTEQRALIEQKQAQGYKLIQIGNANEKPLAEALQSSETIHFVLMKGYEEQKLPWQLIEYRAGGHTDYSWQHWVKQAVVRRSGTRSIYEGDKTLLSFNTEAEAKKYAERVTEAARLFKAGDMVAFDNYVAGNLPKQIGSDIKSGIIDVDSPITHTRSGQHVLDTPHMREVKKGIIGLEDNVNNPYNLFYDVDRKYVGHRDPVAYTVQERGTPTNPLFNLEQAKTIDTKSSMVRGLAGAIKSRYFDDYRTMAAESFVREFGATLIGKEGSLNSDPLFQLFHPNWKDSGSMELNQAAKLYQKNVLDLLQVETDKQASISQVKEKLLNGIYNVAGQKVSNSKAVNEYMMPFIKDPGSYMRAVAFHSTMGFFNPVQWMAQIQTLTHVLAIGGSNALPGMTSAVLMRYLAATESPEIVAHMAGISGKLSKVPLLGGMNKDQFIDSYKWLHKSGWSNVEGEHSLIDDLFNPRIFTSKVADFLHAGTYFFRDSERLTRLAGWNAAYLEWSKANPGKFLDNSAATEVLGRARLMTGDMVRDATAAWSRGIFSMPTQFLNYPARLAEQLMPFVGKRLTTQEKLRAYGVYSAMYGVPTAFGASVGLWPMYDAVKQEALSRGYTETTAGPVITTLLEGIPSQVWSLATGSKTAWSQRLGPQGTSFVRDALSGDKSFLETATGASGSIVGNQMKYAMPFVKSLIDLGFNGGSGTRTLEDFVNASRGISSLNNAAKAVYAINTGKYISRSTEGSVTDMSKFDAMVAFLAGPNPRDVQNTYLNQKTLQQEQKAEKDLAKQATVYIRRAMESFGSNNIDAGNDYWEKAGTILDASGMTPHEVNRTIHQAMDGMEDLKTKVDWDLVNKGRADRYDQRSKALQEELNKKKDNR